MPGTPNRRVSSSGRRRLRVLLRHFHGGGGWDWGAGVCDAGVGLSSRSRLEVASAGLAGLTSPHTRHVALQAN
eukprot:5305858-Alexandrium_andersonii.AAC.1